MKATTVPEQLAAPHVTSGGLLLLVGVLLVAVILAAFVWGRRLKARAPAPPTPEEQPRLPDAGMRPLLLGLPAYARGAYGRRRTSPPPARHGGGR
ncbi:DUF6479 family protein [Streptomyces decoyicus]